MKSILKLFISMNLQFFRSKGALFWSLLFPLFLIIIFGSVFGGQENDFSINVGVANLDSGNESKFMLSILNNIPILKIRENNNIDELKDLLRKRRISFIMVIPDGFKLENNEYKPFELLFDPQQINTNQIGFSVFDQILERMNRSITSIKPVYTIEKEPVMGVRSEIRYIDFLVPGILAMSLLSSALFGIGTVIASEREKGELRRFAVTPLPRSYYIISQLLQRFLVTVMQAIVILGVASLIYKVRIKGSILLLVAMLTIGLLTFSALGYAIAARIKKSETTAAVANVFFLPMMFLSGVYFPLEMMPSYLQPIAKALPLTYLNDSLRYIFNGTVTFQDLILPIIVLSAWFLVCFIFAVKTFIWD